MTTHAWSIEKIALQEKVRKAYDALDNLKTLSAIPADNLNLYDVN